LKERKQKVESPEAVPVIETTPPSPLTANGAPGQFNGSVAHTGRRASEPVTDNLLDLNDKSNRSASFSETPSVQLTPPSPRRLQKPPLKLVWNFPKCHPSERIICFILCTTAFFLL
jgi:hypothetical protein